MNAGIFRKAFITAAVSLSIVAMATSVSVTPVAAQTINAKSSSLPKMGESGPEVTRMQQAIVARGFTIKGGIDGSFGSATQLALKSLQKVAGFRPTGTLDAKTAKFLGLVDVAPLTKSNFPTVGASGDAVWSLQQALINSGVQVKGGADGKFGLATSIALGKFQAMKGLSVTKTVDESTAIALGLLAAPAPKSSGKKTVVAASAPVATPVAAVAPATGSPITIDSLPVRGQKSENVRILQNALINAGIEVKGGADGVFGIATTVALQKYQTANGLQVTGTLTTPTAIKLGLVAAPTISISVFPVQGVCSYENTWHAPRGTNRIHLGVDIIAKEGNLLYAVADGTITKMYSTATDKLAGNGVRLTRADGTYFFYGHMQRVADGIGIGVKVKAGQVLGYLGKTGGTTTPHLHLEVHPFGGEAIDPTPVVAAVDACSVTTPLPVPAP